MTPQKLEAIKALVQAEYAYAEKKHNSWPNDAVHASAIITEELGKLTQACIDYEDSISELKQGLAQMRKYAARVAAILTVLVFLSSRSFGKKCNFCLTDAAAGGGKHLVKMLA